MSGRRGRRYRIRKRMRWIREWEEYRKMVSIWDGIEMIIDPFSQVPFPPYQCNRENIRLTNIFYVDP